MPVNWLFDLGDTRMTPGVQALVQSGVLNPSELLRRHSLGDWGNVSSDDWKENDDAVALNLRIFSVYNITEPPLGKVWVITEADRSTTTVMLPDEY